MESDAKAVPVNKNKRHEKEKRELQCGYFSSAVADIRSLRLKLGTQMISISESLARRPNRYIY